MAGYATEGAKAATSMTIEEALEIIVYLDPELPGHDMTTDIWKVAKAKIEDEILDLRSKRTKAIRYRDSLNQKMLKMAPKIYEELYRPDGPLALDLCRISPFEDFPYQVENLPRYYRDYREDFPLAPKTTPPKPCFLDFIHGPENPCPCTGPVPVLNAIDSGLKTLETELAIAYEEQAKIEHALNGEYMPDSVKEFLESDSQLQKSRVFCATHHIDRLQALREEATALQRRWLIQTETADEIPGKIRYLSHQSKLLHVYRDW